MTTITIDRALLEQALGALEEACEIVGAAWTWRDGKGRPAIVALRAALAQEPAPMTSFPPVSQWQRGCAVCGLCANGNAYGYVCPRFDCPTKVTCGGAV